MPLYACIGRDHRNGIEHRQAVRPEHLKHLDGLGAALVLAGPFQTEAGQSTGSLVVVEASDLAGATALLERDPFIVRGVFQSHEISRWNWGINNPDKRGQ